jgi:hypothetical protein
MHRDNSESPPRSTQTYEECAIVCAYFAEGVTPDQGYRMRDALNELDTDGWWFFNPGTFILAFRSSRSGVKRGQACLSALTRLSNAVDSLGQVRVGSAMGPVLCNLSRDGHLDTPPLGEVVNAAFGRAFENAS